MPQQRSDQQGTANRGFAGMDPARQREIARRGGASVANEKRSFSRNRQLAAEAGRKGGQRSHGSRQSTPAAAEDFGEPGATRRPAPGSEHEPH